jgi:L-malate glycosyltransferase
MRIRVLFVGSFLSKKTGTFSVAENLATTLSDDTFEVRIVSRFHNKLLRLLDIILVSAFTEYSVIKIGVFSGQAFRIAEIASWIGKKRNKKVILNFHGGMLPEFYAKYSKRINRVCKRTKYLFTPSLYLQAFFDRCDIKIEYLPNPVTLKNFSYVRDNVKEFSLLWVRAFDTIYNPDLAIRVLYEVKKTYPGASLTMIGPDKGILAKIITLISDLNLNSDVKILGPISNDKLFTYYNSHSVFLNTTSYESFGLAVVEAAACGIPVVSTKVGEIPYMWQHEENILMVDSFDAIMFSHEVKRLFHSKELANGIAKSARRNIESFDMVLIKEAWIRILFE